MNSLRSFLCALCVLCGSTFSSLRAQTNFRTDSSTDEKLPWFQLKPGEFPPEGSAHSIAGELISIDPINRTGTLRPDRTDAQRRGDWDIAMPFVMLPYSSLAFHGAPAELRDIPLGTHLHGQFYIDPKAAKDAKNPFSRALRLEDDFSFSLEQQTAWRIDSIDRDNGTLTVTNTSSTAPASGAKPIAFQINAVTQVWKGRGLGSIADLAPSQSVLLELTVCTLKGPGRITNTWLDQESRDVATAHQLEVHRQFEREHGLPGWVDEVDNKEGTVTMTLFAGFDPKLLEDFAVNDAITACVAEDNLRTYDQINDRMHGQIVEIQKTPPAPGNSGIRIKFKPGNLLEGFRPQHVLRVSAGKWKVDDLPREERLYQ